MSKELTEAQKLTNYETLQHISKVRDYLNIVICELIKRGNLHDQEKMKEPELSSFVENSAKLKDVTYGSEEYNYYLEKLKSALEHHYSIYRHHPEHFANGVNDMDLIDLVEMFCDWKAASERHADGSISKSINYNKERFKMSEQLTSIFHNTTKLFGE